MLNFRLLIRLEIKARFLFIRVIYFIIALQGKFEVSYHHLNACEIISNCHYGSSYLARFYFYHF